MAASDSVTGGDNLPHTQKVAEKHPKAVKTLADRMGGEEADFLYRVLEDVQ